nr:GAF domain-containing protein [Tanacetum cinerariifolium]
MEVFLYQVTGPYKDQCVVNMETRIQWEFLYLNNGFMLLIELKHRPPKKRKKSHYEITNKICLSGKLSRKGKSVRCDKCGNVGHNMKGCRGQGGTTQDGGSSARNASSQGGAKRTAGVKNVYGQASARQAASTRTVSGQACGASNVST